MRFLIPVLLFIVVSCGKSSSSGDRSPEKEEAISDEIDNVRESDLLDVTLDVPVEITADKMTFRKSANQMVNGVRTNCSLAVENGESWDYTLSGDRLDIYQDRKKITLMRVSDGDTIVGSFTWKGYEGGAFIIRRMTFIGRDRVVMRVSCEN